MSYSFVDIHFGGKKDSGVLTYRLRSYQASQTWAHCIKNASRIRKDNRWYNFDKRPYGSMQSIVDLINGTIDNINIIHPNLITERANMENAQESVNYIHQHFVDSHIVQQKITNKSRLLWDQLNHHLHAFEASERSKEQEAYSGKRNASIVFTWEQSPRKPIDLEDFKNFTIAKKFGAAYVNYSHIGRHLYELFLANDQIASDEHIQPLQDITADTYLWFGPDSGKTGLAKRNKLLQAWFKQNENRFNQLGLYWGDPKLAIGWLPVADLDNNNFQTDSDLISWLAKFDYVESCMVR